MKTDFVIPTAISLRKKMAYDMNRVVGFLAMFAAVGD